MATLNWTQNLTKSAERALALDVSLSYQQDRTINGPLTGERSEHPRSVRRVHTSSRWSSLRLRQLPGHQADDNVRRNQGRITPFDLDRTPTSTLLVDAYRNNAYGR